MTAQKKPPIFYDKKHRRWRYSKRTLVPLVLFLATVFSVTLASVIIPPKLPKLDIQDPAGVYRSAPQSASGIAAASAPASLGAPGLQIPFMQNALLVGQAMDPVDPTTTKPKTLAYFVNWDDNSLVSLKQNLGSIDQLVPEWLNLSDNQGTVTPYNQSYQSDVWGYIQANRPSLRITPLIDNFNNQTQAFDGGRLSAMLENPALRTKTADSLLTYVQQNKFAGISIDFENVSNQDQPDLVLFMQELYQKFHPLGLEVTMNVPLDDSSFNYKALSQNADYLILMAYDEHDVYDTGPGPIASQPWFEAEIANRFSEVSAKKFIISLGNYGYDWSGDNPAPSGSGIDLTFEQAIQEAKKANAAVNLDSQSLNPTFDYTDANNILHHVWFLDGVSVYDQMVAAERSGAPAGFALWRLGAEDPTVWNDFINDKNLDASAAQALSNMQYGYDISYQGQGEILRVTETPQGGWRQINYDSASGLIKKTQIMSYPSPYVINRWGTGSKKIALTFDDGPDNKYTPQILDVLKKENASATFFVIGVNANFSPDIVREEYVNGNEIGNHTYTHPDISKITGAQFVFEVGATQRVIEAITGHKTLLFRPPYAEDIEPTTPDQVKPLSSSNFGYYTVSMHIDPSDWTRPGVSQIVNRVLTAAKNGQGNIVLLHDGGGNREETVQALPKIIEGLRAAGFQIVPVSDLLGISRDSVMPKITFEERAIAYANDITVQVASGFNQFMLLMFKVGIILGTARFIFIGLLAIAQWTHSRRGAWRKLSRTVHYKPSVSVIIPAYNEEKVVVKTVDSILRSTYPNFNIIVVDDGSTDGTWAVLENNFGKNGWVKIFRKENGGKSSALNFGIAMTKAEIIVTLDADTVFRSDTIEKLVRCFLDRRVAAVAGNAKVGNRINILTRWQALEYITSQNLDRRAFEALNCITVVPGAVGAWRRSAILEAGGFSEDTLAEDADLTFSIIRQGHQVAYDDEAIAYTEAPDSTKNFIKQRFRWMYGMFQTAWKHKDLAVKKEYNALGFLGIPNIFIFQIFFPLVSPLMDLMMVITLFWGAWQTYFHPAGDISPLYAFKKFLIFYIFFLLVDLVTAAIPFFLEHKEDWRLLFWLPLQRFYYRQLMYYVAIKAVVTALKGRLVKWGKFERKATVVVMAGLK